MHSLQRLYFFATAALATFFERSRWGRQNVLTLVLCLGAAAGTVLLYAGLSRLSEHPGLAGVSVQMKVDQDASLTIEQISRVPVDRLTPVSQTVALGFTPAALWFRMEVPQGMDTPAEVVVQPSYLDDVRVYLRPSDGVHGWQEHQLGDLRPFSWRAAKHLAFGVPLQARGGDEIFVRVKTRNASNIRLRLLQVEAAQTENSITLAGVGLYCGAVLLLAFASVFSAVVYRDPLWAANALFQLMTMVTMFVYFGLANQFLFPDEPRVADKLSVLCGFAQFFFGTLLYRLIYGQYGAPRWLTDLHALGLLVFPIQLLLMLQGQDHLALRLVGYLLPLTIVQGVIMSALLKCPDRFLLNLLQINMVSTTTGFVLLYLTHIGWMQASMLQLYPGVIINLVTAVTLHLVLVRRSLKLESDRRLALSQLALSQQQVALERVQREDASRFLGMLLHEMRSVLSVVVVAVSALEKKLLAIARTGYAMDATQRDLGRIERSVRQMRDVLQQVQLTSEMEHRQEQPGAQRKVRANCRTQALSLVKAHPLAPRLTPQSLDRLAQGDAQVQGREPVVAMMIGNLLDNAHKYSAANSPIRVESFTSEAADDGPGLWTFAVANQVGPIGVPDAQMLFTKYYRAPAAHQFSGTGLGLYWVRGVARLHGGDVRYRQEGDEVVFELCLPLVEALSSHRATDTDTGAMEDAMQQNDDPAAGAQAGPP